MVLSTAKRALSVIIGVASLSFGVNQAVRSQSVPIIVSVDGDFLGVVSNDSYDRDSICNSHGRYGSRHSNTSIWNQHGRHGSRHSRTGAYNERSNEPPALVINGEIAGFITKNTRFEYQIDPDLLYYQVCGQ